MKKLLQSISNKQLIIVGLVMAAMPIVPEPHLFQKTKMLLDGSLTKLIDIFDVFWHTLPFWVLGIKKLVEKGSTDTK